MTGFFFFAFAAESDSTAAAAASAASVAADRRQLSHLRLLLSESEAENARLQQMSELLKEEIRFRISPRWPVAPVGFKCIILFLLKVVPTGGGEAEAH